MDKELLKVYGEFLETQKEAVMLLAILVKRGSLQGTLIKEMSSVGMMPKRIAELLNTTANTVQVARSVSKKGKGLIKK
jgi:hypothetical protein